MVKNFFRIVLLAVTVSAIAQETTIPVSGSSDSNSPVLLRGSLVVNNDSMGPLDYTAHLTLVNASGKDIILIVTNVSTEVTADGVTTSQSENIGIDDYFLKATPFQAQSTKLLELQVRPYSKAGEKITGKAGGDARVIFVQFADGSTWGDLGQAKEFTDERVNAWQELQHLADIYQTKGKEQFLSALRDPAAKSPYLQTLVSTEGDADSIETFVRELNRLLELGASQLGQMGGHLIPESN